MRLLRTKVLRSLDCGCAFFTLPVSLEPAQRSKLQEGRRGAWIRGKWESPLFSCRLWIAESWNVRFLTMFGSHAHRFTKTVESVILESAIYQYMLRRFQKPNHFPLYAAQIPRFQDSRARFDAKFGAHSQIPRFQDSGWLPLQRSLPLSMNPRLRSPPAAPPGQEV